MSILPRDQGLRLRSGAHGSIMPTRLSYWTVSARVLVWVIALTPLLDWAVTSIV
jgi:hypothetical protein